METTGYLVWRLSTKWRTAVGRVVAPLGLTHAQFSLLAALTGVVRGGQRPSQRELAEHTGMEPIYVSKLARALEKMGLVERPTDPHDPRAVQLTLTARGHEAIGQAITLVDTLQAEQLDPIGGAESDHHQQFRETLLTLLGETSAARTENESIASGCQPFNGRDIDGAASATRAILDGLLTQAGLSFSEWAALHLAALKDTASKNQTRADIAFFAPSTSQPTVAVNLQHLEEAGLVHYVDGDVKVTNQGLDLFERVGAASELARKRLVEGVTQADLEATKRVLDTISERAKKVHVEL